MNYTGPKVKHSRKLGFSLTPKARKYMDRKPYPPGQHGVTKRRAKLSDYGRQLFEKQRLRLQYNVSERQMQHYFAHASRMSGNTGDNLLQLLESRLDALVYRAGLAPTIYAARQYVRHGHLEVNGKKVDIPSYAVKPNDMIRVREKSRMLECFQNSIRNAQPVSYLEVSKADLSAKYLYMPPREEIPVICEVPLVVEYYAR